MNRESATSLALAGTNDLLVELLTRYDHAIFAGIKLRPQPAHPDAHIRSWRYVGSEQIGIALGHKMMRVCQDNLDRQETTINADEL